MRQVTLFTFVLVLLTLTLTPLAIAGYYTDQNKAAYWDGCSDNGESVASGVYFYHLSAGDYSTMKRMVIVK